MPRHGQAASKSTEDHAVLCATRSRRATQRRVVDRLQGRLRAGRARCYPLTVADAHSRYIIACIALTNTRSTTTRRALERVFAEYGLPDAIRTDNGSPFSSKGWAVYRPSRCGGGGSASGLNASSLGTRSRTGATSACIAI